MAALTPKRYDVFLTSLDPALGGEMRKTRPVVVVSQDEMNRHLTTIVVWGTDDDVGVAVAIHVTGGGY